MHTHIHTYMHACMHVYIHTYIHTYVHTYIHWPRWAGGQRILLLSAHCGATRIEMAARKTRVRALQAGGGLAECKTPLLSSVAHEELNYCRQWRVGVELHYCRQWLV